MQNDNSESSVKSLKTRIAIDQLFSIGTASGQTIRNTGTFHEIQSICCTQILIFSCFRPGHWRQVVSFYVVSFQSL